MQRLSIFAAVAVLALSAGAAPAAPAADQAGTAATNRQCFRMSQIQNHTNGDDQTLYFRIRNTDVFRMTMSGNCLVGASTNDPLVLTPVAGLDVICRPLDLDVKVKLGPGGGLSPCIIQQMTKLTPEEVAALPPKVRP